MRQHVGKVWRALREPCAEIAQRQMTEQLALERRKHYVGVRHILGQFRPARLSKPFALQNVARHSKEITQHPRQLEDAAMPEEILVGAYRTRDGTQGCQVRRTFNGGEVLPQRE